jgi:hypothetical protein
MKTLDELSLDELGFIEFEHRVGGAPHVSRALKGLCEVVPLGGCDCQIVERALTAPVAWLMINALRHADIIEQGPSMRSIRFTDRGVFLAEFVRVRSVENLAELIDESASETPSPCCGISSKGLKVPTDCHDPPARMTTRRARGVAAMVEAAERLGLYDTEDAELRAALRG